MQSAITERNGCTFVYGFDHSCGPDTRTSVAVVAVLWKSYVCVEKVYPVQRFPPAVNIFLEDAGG